jgi:methylmalonyl-CoA mutase
VLLSLSALPNAALGAMETGYQRGGFRTSPCPSEMLKHTGELPIIGVNTFRNPHGDAVQDKLEPGLPTEKKSRASSAA